MDGSTQPDYRAVSGADGLVTFTGVAEGSYTLEESEAPAGYVKDNGTWTFNVAKGKVFDAAGDPYDNENPLTVINEPASVPAPETVEIRGTKTWKGDREANRPERIIVNLLANGEAVDEVEVTAESQWTFSFIGKAKYDESGAEIVYTVQEEAVAGYTVTYNGFDITNTKKVTPPVYDFDYTTKPEDDTVKPEDVTTEPEDSKPSEPADDYDDATEPEDDITEPEDDTTEPEGSKPSDSPKTGDSSNMFLWIALLFVSGLGTVATIVFGKKKFSVK